MKKYLIIALAAMATMACAKIESNDSTPDTPIRFSVVSRLQQTKASTTGVVYPTSVPFGTFAWWTENNWTGIAADQTNVFMDNEQVSYNSTSKTWVPSQTYYWTKAGKLTFTSYSPYVNAETKASKGFSAIPSYHYANGFQFTNYTIVSATDVDLMYSNLAANCTQDSNSDGSLVYDGTTSGENPTDHGYKGVPTIFNHALCQIGFSFRAAGTLNPNVTAIQVDVKSVIIRNIDNKGSFTQTSTPRWSSTHAAANYTSYTFLAATDEPINLVLAANPSYTDLNERKILLPQALQTDDDPTDPTVDPIATTTDQVLELNYIIKTHYASNPVTDTANAAYWATEDITSRVRLNNGNIATWGDNKNITYKITINPYDTTPITFDPAVVTWTDVNSNEIVVTPPAE